MSSKSHRFAITAVTLTYVAVTVGESILAPILPIASRELPLTEEGGGRILGILSVAAGIGNLAGGFALGRFGTKAASLSGLALTVSGAVAAALDGGAGAFTLAHVLLGLGAGVFFASGIYAIGVLADPSRRGRAMGRFGISYSLALAVAAGLVAVIGSDSWRSAFAVAAGLGVIAIAAVALAELPPRSDVPKPRLGGQLNLLRIPVAVGAVAAVAQFGLVAFVPTFAVEQWALSASAAAVVLLVGRVISIPGKAWAGRLADHSGAIGAARFITVTLLGTGATWLLIPTTWIGSVAAAMFAGAAGAMFPVANVVAVERFGDHASLLGVFRSAQMVVAGVSAWLVGLGAETIGLRSVLLIGVAGLAGLLLIPERERSSEPPSSR